MDNVYLIAPAWMGLALVASLVSTRFFEPRAVEAVAAEELDAAGEIDAGPLPRPRLVETA